MKILDSDAIMSADDITADETTYLFPNPTKGKLQISTKNEHINHIQITDQSGRVLLENSVSRNTAEINISKLKKGVYFVIATFDNKQRYVQKIFKQ